MTDDRTEMQAAREAGLRQRHEQRLARVHQPVGVRPTDMGVFVCCSCGKNPTPKLWLETHWAGEREEGKQLVLDLISKAREPVEADAKEAGHGQEGA